MQLYNFCFNKDQTVGWADAQNLQVAKPELAWLSLD